MFSVIIEAHRKYAEHGYITFGLSLAAKVNDENQIKKDVNPPKEWQKFTLQSSVCKETQNALGILCGKINGIFVIDVDNRSHWQNYLAELGHNEDEFHDHVQQITASGGLHLVFAYDNDMDSVKGRSRAFGRKYDIDTRTNGNFIYVAPSQYKGPVKDSDDLQADFKYSWLIDILEQKPKAMPSFLKQAILNVNLVKKTLPTSHKPVSSSRNCSENKNMAAISQFVVKHYGIEQSLHGQPVFQQHKSKSQKNKMETQLILPMKSRYCYFLQKEHSSNHTYICLDKNNGCRFKCHDDLCRAKKHGNISWISLPPEIRDIITKEDFSDKEQCSIPADEVDNNEQLIENQLKAIAEFGFPTEPSQETLILTSSAPVVKFPDGFMQDLSENYYCPICKKHHDRPCNRIFITSSGSKYLLCSIGSGFFPNPVAKIPPQQLGAVFQDNRTIVNQFITDVDLLNLDAHFEEVVPIFDDWDLNQKMFASFKGFASDIGLVFFYLSKDLLCVESGDRNVWWSYNQIAGIWEQGITPARLFCSEVVAEKYMQAQRYFRENTPDPELAKRRDLKLDAIIKRLKDKDKNSILDEAADFFKRQCPNFESKLDDNQHLLAFHGQVKNLYTGELRASCSSDLLTRSCGYTLPDHIDMDVRAQIMAFFNDILPNEEEVKYVLTWLASCLDGYNKEEIYTIMAGKSGRNGKGAVRDLMAAALGGISEEQRPSNSYFHTIQASMLTHERPSSSSPCPDLLNLRGKRFVVGSEPEKNAGINVGFLKMLTGNDIISGRWCHGNSELHFKPQHSIALQCNSIPALDAEDDAIWKRSRIVEFPFVFTENPSKSGEKKIDLNLKERISKWGPQFMLLLLEQYDIYKCQGLKATRSVLKMTDQIREENDPLLQFVREKIEKATEDFRIERSELIQAAKCCISVNAPHFLFSTQKLTNCIYRRLGAEWSKSNGKYYLKGYKFII